jgi:hypothetical protein
LQNASVDAAAHEQIRHMLEEVKAAETIMEQSSADGPARATWYGLIVEGAVAAAQSLAIPLMIGETSPTSRIRWCFFGKISRG